MCTSKVALEAMSREPGAPGGRKTRLKDSLKTGFRKVSVCTTMPPDMSTTGFISARPTFAYSTRTPAQLRMSRQCAGTL